MMKRITLLIIALAIFTLNVKAQNIRAQTYCNPLNVDYTYMIYNSHNDLSYRSGADPAVVGFEANIICSSPVLWATGTLPTFIIGASLLLRNGIHRKQCSRCSQL